MSINDLRIWKFVAKGQTAIGACAALVLLEISARPLWGLPFVSGVFLGADSKYQLGSVLGKLVSGLCALGLFWLLCRQQWHHFKLLAAPPLRESLYHPLKTGSNMVIVIGLMVILLLFTVLMKSGWAALFHVTILLLAIAWEKEASRDNEMRLSEALQRVKRNSAEAMALLFHSKMWTGAVAQILAIQLGAWAIWTYTHSAEATFAVVGASSLGIGLFYGLLALSSVRTASRFSK